MGIFDSIGSASSLFDSLKDSFSQYIVTPLNAFGVAGFVFDVEGDAAHNLSAEITDHYTEGNFAVQDHIAIKPKKIILKQYVGELVYRQNGEGENSLQNMTRKLTVLNSYLPVFTSGAKQALDILNGKQEAVSFNDVLNKSVDIYGIFKNLNPPVPRQQQAYQFFKALMEQKILVSVQTPFEYASNMAIESIVSTQPEGSAYISDFTITLKEIRLARSKKTTLQFEVQRAAQNDIQAATAVHTGKNAGVSAAVESILPSWLP